MASFSKLPSGKWRAMVRKHGHTVSCSFRLKAEADWDIHNVAMVSGHKDWKMLQRYTHLRPTFVASRASRRRSDRGT